MSFLRLCFGAQPHDLHQSKPKGECNSATNSLHNTNTTVRNGGVTVLRSPEPSVHPGSRPLSEDEQLEKLFDSVAAACNSKADLWVTLQKMVDLMASLLPSCCISIQVLTSSHKHFKILADSSSPLRVEGGVAAPLQPISELPSILEAVANGKTVVVQAPAAGSDSSEPCLSPEYQLLHDTALCDTFTHIPLLFGGVPQGSLLIASRCYAKPPTQRHRWLASFCPLLSMYLSEARAVQLCDIVERLQLCGSVNALAWAVVQHLHTCFEWCHPDETEARLVLLNEEQASAVVLSRPLPARDSASCRDAAAAGFTPSVSTASSNLSSADGKPGGEGGELLGVRVPLLNTLTQRCINEHSKLLFIDVMSAIKNFKEPWRDVFLDNTVVTNPTWVIASPIMSGQKYLGAILWLSSTRLNTQRILQAARAGVPPVVKAVAQRLQQLSAMSDAAPLWRQVLSTASALLDVPAQPRRLRSQLSGLDSLGPGTPRGPIDMSSDASFVLKSMSAVIDAPSVRCSILKSDAASTQALVRAYEAKIAQHQRTIGSEAPDRVLAEVEVISKAGQGAFGSVYTAMWQGRMVAVKIIKFEADGRKTLRTAWELAVAKSVQHANVVKVHAVLTDVIVEKASQRVVRFCRSEAMPTETLDVIALETMPETPRCQVLIMEYCNLGTISQFLADKRFMRNVGSSGTAPPPNASMAFRPGSWQCESSLAQSPGPFAGARQPGGAAVRRAKSMVLMQVCLEAILPPLIDVASAMQYLHSCDIVHCDLKPENLLIKTAGSGDNSSFVVKVTDFGLCDLFTAEGPLIGEMGGTLTHVAPEVATQQKVTKACDTYSFGILMYELYTSERPYADVLKTTSDKALLARIVHEGLRPQFPKGACSRYARLAQRCWMADPAQRPAFADILAELRAMLTDAQAAAAAQDAAPSGEQQQRQQQQHAWSSMPLPVAVSASAPQPRSASAALPTTLHRVAVVANRLHNVEPSAGSGGPQGLQQLRLRSPCNSSNCKSLDPQPGTSSPRLRQVYPDLKSTPLSMSRGSASYNVDRSNQAAASIGAAGAVGTSPWQQLQRQMTQTTAGGLPIPSALASARATIDVACGNAGLHTGQYSSLVSSAEGVEMGRPSGPSRRSAATLQVVVAAAAAAAVQRGWKHRSKTGPASADACGPCSVLQQVPEHV